MKRFKKPKQATVTLTEKDIKQIKADVTENAVGTASLLYMVAMMDEFGHNTEDIEKVFIRATRYARYIDDHVATMRDLANTLEKNTGIKVKWR